MTLQTDWFNRTFNSMLLFVATFPLLATTALAAANTQGLVDIGLQGVGTGAIAAGACTSPAIACTAGHSCQCFTAALTLVGNQGFNNGSLAIQLSVDVTNSTLPISTVGFCQPAGGSGTIANKNGKQTISIDVSGLVCPTLNPSITFSGTYFVTAGSKFSGGTGAINGSLAGGEARVSLNGNVQP